MEVKFFLLSSLEGNASYEWSSLQIWRSFTSWSCGSQSSSSTPPHSWIIMKWGTQTHWPLPARISFFRSHIENKGWGVEGGKVLRRNRNCMPRAMTSNEATWGKSKISPNAQRVCTSEHWYPSWRNLGFSRAHSELKLLTWLKIDRSTDLH